MSMFTYGLPDGSTFVAHERADYQYPLYGGAKSEEDLAAHVAKLWQDAYESKKPDTDELIRNEKLYSGFHYETPQSNRNNVVANLAFAAVEDVWPALIETRPRPEIVPHGIWSAEKAARMQAFAEWLMDRGWFDQAIRLGDRTKLKQGWNVHLIVFDHDTGMPYAKAYSNFNFYRDPAATSEESLQYYFLAAPVPTDVLRAQFPQRAADIHPDGIASPEYEATVRPYYENQRGNAAGVIGPLLSFSKATEPVPSTSTRLLAGTEFTQRHAQTTFLLQLFIRDRSYMRVPYKGSIALEDGTQVPGITKWFKEPCSPSGWTVVQMTASGKILDCGPLDPAFDGMNVVVGRDYDQRPYKFEGVGEIRIQAPVNRSFNRRYNLVNKSAEFETTPALLYDQGAGTDLQNRQVTPGESLKKQRGSEIKWLEHPGVSEQQFKMMELELRLWQMLTGNQDASQGRTPGGIEAASAFREMRMASQKRVRGKEPGLFDERAQLLKKLMVCAAKKLRRRIFFRASGGQLAFVDPDEVLEGWDIRFAQGSGTAYTRAEQEEKAVTMFQIGLIDQQAALEDLDYRRRGEVLTRAAAMREMELKLAEQQSQQGNKNEGSSGSNGSTNGGKPNPAEARR